MSRHIRIFLTSGSYVETSTADLVDIESALAGEPTPILRPLMNSAQLAYARADGKAPGSIRVDDRRTHNRMTIALAHITHVIQFDE